jgi:hypothetical protein
MEGLFRGTWYRSAVKLEGETIIPIPLFTPYDPFNQYYSASEIRQGERSLYLEFLGVDSDKPQEVVKFCERFGVLGALREAKPEGRKFHPLDSLTNHKVSPHLRKRFLAATRDSLDPIMWAAEDLCLPLPIGVFQRSQTLLRLLIKFPNEDEKLPREIITDFQKRLALMGPQKENLAGNIDQFLTRLINEFLRDSRVTPQLQWSIQKNKWEMAWNSFSLFGYFCTMVMLDKLGPGKFLSCPRCHKFFLTSSNLVRFCSSSCGENFKVREYQRKKKELAAQKSKKKKAAKSSTRKK